MSALPSTVVIGGGIAGLASAWSLARHGERPLLLEAEPLNFSHSSGRNAAIFRPLETSAAVTQLVAHSERLLPSLSEDTPLVERRGLVLAAADRANLTRLLQVAEEHDVAHTLLQERALIDALPLFANGRCRYGIHLPTGGVLDIHALGETLRRRLVDLHVELRASSPVRGINVTRGRVTGVQLVSGERLSASRVVIAAGAWSSVLGSSCDCALPLTPHRRHLTHLRPVNPTPRRSAVAWDVETGVYVRHEGTGILACPGDHEPHPPGLPSVDPAQLERLAERLPSSAPALVDAQVQRAWACLRTMAEDREPVIGSDPRASGLFWATALGGFGMSAGLGAGELLAKAVLGVADPLLAAVNPARLVPKTPAGELVAPAG